MMKHFIQFSSLALASFLLAACQSVPDRMADRMVDVRDEWVESLTRANGTPTIISLSNWTEATELILAHNLNLRQAIADSEFAARERGMVYRRLLPELRFTGGVNKRITELNTFTFDDVFLIANGFVQLPNPVEVRARALSAHLFSIRADIGGQLLYRELFASLYRLHRKQLRIDETDARIAEMEQVVAALREISPTRASDMELEARRLRIQNQAAATDLQSELSALLGDSSARYQFSESFVAPSLQYVGTEDIAQSVLDYGNLYAASAAVQLVGLELQSLGIAVNDWPRLQAFVTLPSLWSRRGGDNTFADFDLTRIGITGFWPTDFRGQRRLQRDRLESSHEFSRERISQMVKSEANRLVMILSQGVTLQEELDLIEQRLAVLKPLLESDIRRVRVSALDQVTNLRTAQTAIEDRIAEINLALWVLDDSQWKEIYSFRDGIFAFNLEF